MTSKRYKLSLHAKTLLLKHRIDIQFDECPDYDEYGDFCPPTGLFATKLVKFLMVSKSFLHLSQREKMYEFLIKDEIDNLFSCGFPWSHKPYYSYSSFMLSFEKLHKLVLFLRPRQVIMYFGYIHGFEAIEQCKKILDFANGKIRLYTVGYPSKIVPTINILLKNHAKICELECEAEILSEIGLIPRLNLDSCELKEIKNYVQLNNVLQNHNIKKLKLYFNSSYNENNFKFSDLENKFLTASSVISLKLCSNEKDIKDDNFLKKMAKLVEFLPNLKKFKNKVMFKQEEKMFHDETVYNSIFNLYNDCRQIQNGIKLDAKLEFNFSERFIKGTESNFSHNWHTQLKQVPGFENANNIETVGVSSSFRHKIVEENFHFSIYVSFPLLRGPRT